MPGDFRGRDWGSQALFKAILDALECSQKACLDGLLTSSSMPASEIPEDLHVEEDVEEKEVLHDVKAIPLDKAIDKMVSVAEDLGMHIPPRLVFHAQLVEYLTQDGLNWTAYWVPIPLFEPRGDKAVQYWTHTVMPRVDGEKQIEPAKQAFRVYVAFAADLVKRNRAVVVKVDFMKRLRAKVAAIPEGFDRDYYTSVLDDITL